MRGTTTDESQMAPCPCLRHSAICGGIRALRSAYGGLRCRSGRCLTSGLRSASVVAGRVVYTPFRSLLDACHRHAATLALSTPHSYHLARPMSVSHCVQARPALQPPSGAFIVNKKSSASGTLTLNAFNLVYSTVTDFARFLGWSTS